MTKFTTIVAAAALLAGSGLAFAQGSNDKVKSQADVKPMNAGAASDADKNKAATSGSGMTQPTQNTDTTTSGSSNMGGSKKNTDSK